MEKGQGKRMDTLQTDNVYTRKEYIERDAAIEIAMQYCPDDDGVCSKANADLREMLDEIEAIPAADVVPVRHGRWIDNKVAFYLGCSECGCYLEYAVDTFLDNGEHYHYCPNCGARMDKDGGGE